MGKLVWGIGINDRRYLIEDACKNKTTNYQRWVKSLKEITKLDGGVVDDAFINFGSFVDWVNSFENEITYKSMMTWRFLDPINKTFGPKETVFIPVRMRGLLLAMSPKRYETPTHGFPGILYDQALGKYSAQFLTRNSPEYRKYGKFRVTPEEAYEDYRTFWNNYAKHLLETHQGKLDNRVKIRMSDFVLPTVEEVKSLRLQSVEL